MCLASVFVAFALQACLSETFWTDQPVPKGVVVIVLSRDGFLILVVVIEEHSGDHEEQDENDKP